MADNSFEKITHAWLAIIGSIGTAGLVLLKLRMYSFGYGMYGNPWPTQQRMAQEMKISRRAFSAAVAKLSKLGYVSVEKVRNSLGVLETVYRIDVPVSEMVHFDDDVESEEESNPAEALAARVDPAPTVKKPTSAGDKKSQLFEQFTSLCAPALNPRAARGEFMKLKLENAVKAIEAVKGYTAVFNAAAPDRQRFFTHCRNWLANEEYLTPSAWRQRAGVTLRASGHTDASNGEMLDKLQAKTRTV